MRVRVSMCVCVILWLEKSVSVFVWPILVMRAEHKDDNTQIGHKQQINKNK